MNTNVFTENFIKIKLNNQTLLYRKIQLQKKDTVETLQVQIGSFELFTLGVQKID